MNKRFVNTTIILFLAISIGTSGLFLRSFFTRPPAELGVNKGHLAACKTTPNCVSSRDYNSNRYLQPLHYVGESSKAIAILKKIIADMPGSKLITAEENYLHAEFTSRVFRFVDDVEFYINQTNQEIHFRSASRIGYSDFGVNEKRIHYILRQFELAANKR